MICQNRAIYIRYERMIGNKFFKYALESHVQTRHCLEIDFIYDLHIHVCANCLLHL